MKLKNLMSYLIDYIQICIIIEIVLLLNVIDYYDLFFFYLKVRGILDIYMVNLLIEDEYNRRFIEGFFCDKCWLLRIWV